MADAIMQAEKREVLAVFPDAYAAYLPFCGQLGAANHGWLIRARIDGMVAAPLTDTRYETAREAWTGAFHALKYWNPRLAATSCR